MNMGKMNKKELNVEHRTLNIQHRMMDRGFFYINVATKNIHVYHMEAMGYALAPPILHTERKRTEHIEHYLHGMPPAVSFREGLFPTRNPCRLFDEAEY
jgi:hypothetical protein